MGLPKKFNKALALLILSSVIFAGCGQKPRLLNDGTSGILSVLDSVVTVSNTKIKAGKTVDISLYLVDTFGEPLTEIE